MLAQFDGQQKLVVVELPSLKWRAKALWKSSFEAKHLAVAPSGKVLAVLKRGGPWRSSFIRIVEVGEGSPREIVHRIDGGLFFVAGFDSEHVWAVFVRWKSPHCPGEHVQDLARIRLSDGATEFLTESIVREPETRLTVAANTADGWFVVFRWLGVFQLKDGKFQQVYKCQSEMEDVSVAVSDDKRLAILSSAREGDPINLQLVHGSKRVSLDLPIGGTGLRWNNAKSLPDIDGLVHVGAPLHGEVAAQRSFDGDEKRHRLAPSKRMRIG